MKTFFIISLSIVVITLILMFLHKKITHKVFPETPLGGLCIFLCIMFTVSGLIIIPLTKDYKKEVIEITNYEVIRAPHSIILDVSDSPEVNSANLIQFDNHEIVECYNDSIKFFIMEIKSFYNISLYRKFVWSKPPYTYYNYK